MDCMQEKVIIEDRCLHRLKDVKDLLVCLLCITPPTSVINQKPHENIDFFWLVCENTSNDEA